MEIEMPPTPSRLLRISTEMFPARERFAAFREEFARQILKMDVIDHSAGCPRVELAFMPLGAVAAGTVSCTSAEWVRGRHHLKDCNDDFRLTSSPPAQFKSRMRARSAFTTLVGAIS
jgi:hypothetical protein